MDTHAEVGPSRQAVSRRGYLQLSIAGALSVFIGGCGKSKSVMCGDPAKLSDAELSLRTSLHYSEESPEAGKACSGCGFFDAVANNPCGSCRLLKGPVSPRGHCDSWSAAKG